MAARSKPQVDCPHCGMNSFLCICGIFPKLLLATRVSVIIPWLEWLRTSNTGRLVELLLENSRVLIRGKKGSPMAPEEPLAAGYANLVLYPGGRPLSRELAASFGSPVNLIVPDGTWESAGRTIVRETVLGELPRVSLHLRLRRSTVCVRARSRSGSRRSKRSAGRSNCSRDRMRERTSRGRSG